MASRGASMAADTASQAWASASAMGASAYASLPDVGAADSMSSAYSSLPDVGSIGQSIGLNRQPPPPTIAPWTVARDQPVPAGHTIAGSNGQPGPPAAGAGAAYPQAQTPGGSVQHVQLRPPPVAGEDAAAQPVAQPQPQSQLSEGTDGQQVRSPSPSRRNPSRLLAQFGQA